MLRSSLSYFSLSYFVYAAFLFPISNFSLSYFVYAAFLFPLSYFSLSHFVYAAFLFLTFLFRIRSFPISLSYFALSYFAETSAKSMCPTPRSIAVRCAARCAATLQFGRWDDACSAALALGGGGIVRRIASPQAPALSSALGGSLVRLSF